MTETGYIQDGILLPFQDHSWRRKGLDLDYRTVPLFVRILDRNDTIGEGLGHYQVDQDANGDPVCIVQWSTAGEGQRPVGAWSWAWPAVVTAEAPSADIEPGRSVVVGTRTGETLLPAYDRFWTPDQRFRPLQVEADEGGARYPVGTKGVVLGATVEDRQDEVFFTGEQRLVAVNHAGRSSLSSQIFDLTDRSEYDEDRWGYLHTAWRVARPQPGLVPWNRDHGALAWQLGRSGPLPDRAGNIPGYGLCCAAPRVQPDAPPPTILTCANGKQIVIQPAAPNTTSSPAGTPPIYAAAGIDAGGPLSVGLASDTHGVGNDIDGSPINAVHIDTGALFLGNGGDGPLSFEGGYPTTYHAPLPTPVHLAWDPGTPHQFLGTAKAGKWRWWAEVPIIITPPPPEPPEKPALALKRPGQPQPPPPQPPPPPEKPREPRRRKTPFDLALGDPRGAALVNDKLKESGKDPVPPGQPPGAAAAQGQAGQNDEQERRRRRQFGAGIVGIGPGDKHPGHTGEGGVVGIGPEDVHRGPGPHAGIQQPGEVTGAQVLPPGSSGGRSFGAGVLQPGQAAGAQIGQGGGRGQQRVGAGIQPYVGPSDPIPDLSIDPLGAVPPRRRDVTDPKEPQAMTTVPLATPALMARPAYLSYAGIDLRKRRTSAPAALAAYLDRAPNTARLEGFVRETDAGGEPDYTVLPCEDRHGGGSAPGGWIFMPPEIDALDAFDGATTTERGAPLSDTCLVFYESKMSFGVPQRTGSECVSDGWTIERTDSDLTIARSSDNTNGLLALDLDISQTAGQSAGFAKIKDANTGIAYVFEILTTLEDEQIDAMDATTGWAASGVTGNPSLSSDTVNKTEGTASLQVDVDGTYAGTDVIQVDKTFAADDISLHSSVKVDLLLAPLESVDVVLRLEDGSTVTEDSAQQSFTNPSALIFMMATITFPIATEWTTVDLTDIVRYEFRLEDAVGGAHTWRLDDLRLEA